jgi:hypothetical protein
VWLAGGLPLGTTGAVLGALETLALAVADAIGAEPPAAAVVGSSGALRANALAEALAESAVTSAPAPWLRVSAKTIAGTPMRRTRPAPMPPTARSFLFERVAAGAPEMSDHVLAVCATGPFIGAMP